MSSLQKAFQRAFLFLFTGVLLAGILASCHPYPSFAAEAVLVTKPIYHKHTGSSAGGGCYGEEKTKIEVDRVPCGGTLVYYPASDTSGCESCGAGYFGDQSDKTCWDIKLVDNPVVYYELNCGKGDAQLGNLILEESTEEWTKALTLTARLENYGDILPSETPYIWNGSPSEEAVYSVSENGVYSLGLQADDNTATEKLCIELDVRNIDKTGPAVTLTDSEKEEGVQRGQIIVEAEDLQPDGTAGCGLAEQPYSFDEGATWEKNNSRKVTANGTYSVWVRDRLDNITTAQIEIVNMDTFGPRVRHVLETSEWSKNPIRLTFFVEDVQPDGRPGIGLPENFIDWGKGEGWEKTTSTLIYTNEVVKIRCRDAYGNVTAYEVEIDNLDQLAPEATVTTDESTLKEEENTWIRVEAGDAESGLHETPYSYDKGASWTVEKEKEVTGPGEYSVWVRDAVDNISFQSVTIEEELLPPAVQKKQKWEQKQEPVVEQPLQRVAEKEEKSVALPTQKQEKVAEVAKIVEEVRPFRKQEWFGNLIALGGTGALACCLWLLYYYGYATVRIYNYEEGGNYAFLGRERIGRREGEFRLLILKEMVEASVTTRYKFRPGICFAKLHRGETLILDFAGEYRTLTEIDREMIAKNCIATSLKL